MLKIEKTDTEQGGNIIKVVGGFNFLNIGLLIAPLEDCLESLQNDRSLKELELYFYFTHLDARGVRVLINYLDELSINSLLYGRTLNVKWSYDWFDDSMKELATFSQEHSALNITLKEIPPLRAV